MTAPAATVLIVNYDSGDRLAKCLAHLERQTRRDFETIVVDNQSTDGSQAAARRAGVVLIEAGANLGFAAANNLGAKRARGEWLVFLNPDAYPAPDWFEKLMEGAARYPWADAFGSAQLDAADPGRIDGAGDVFHVLGVPYRGHFGWPAEKLPADGECFAPCAAAAMYRRTRFDALGGFDESFFCYGEDVDLGFRLRLAGGRCVQLSHARVLHEGSGVTGRRSDFTVYHGNRNRIWTTYKNMPGALYWPLMPLRIAADLCFLARAYSVGTGPSYARALRDGYGGLAALKEKRRAIQKARRVSAFALARMLVWSPVRMLRREGALRPLRAAIGRHESGTANPLPERSRAKAP
ncbi:glycosyltransferase family 2 protein [Amphiplicatus metriothermophilus]|uniref:Glycosyltransferase, GT2 family n=1 Tax=Amphiplicatus metriothermophilus TaxID=1519374 RepID=A0A239PMS8_9PROT|nr:glycosyltransferase family 2 protein [Amphiplicatus metriothermophilus]MBB5517220.1 GT2 family glycosyltransferase [Amphiplicatus metriothermophilus]SNT68444.1 Glycosyltransferase, GT2 family [Amphiplicatus metriothermophilus]